jgi:tetratricopeptide (TPR) repeat protein
LKGNYYLNRRRPGLEGALRSFEAAIQADPAFGRAYAGLATTQALLSYFGATRIDDRIARVTSNARRALDIDSTLAEARVALGILYAAVNQFAESERELRHAIALEPDNAAAHFQLGRILLYFGRIEEATEELERAKNLEPYHATTACWLALALARASTLERAKAEADRAWELDSLAIETGRVDMARRIAEWVPKNHFNAGTFAWVMAVAGSDESARDLVRAIDERNGAGWLDQVNLSYATLALKDTARALAAMETGLQRQEPIASWIPLWSRAYDPVRSTPRFRAFLQRVGLDEATLLAARRSSP